ncbi:MAG: hypothetical protein WCX64_05065 [Candidatus Micrarchaeia archaeon]
MENETPQKSKEARKAEFEKLHQEFIGEATQRANAQTLQALDRISIAKKSASQIYHGLKEVREAGDHIRGQKYLDKHPPNPLFVKWKFEHDAEHPNDIVVVPGRMPIEATEIEPVNPEKLRKYVQELQKSGQCNKSEKD